MLADIIHKVAGFERDDDREYFPRPSLCGPSRCIRQMVYWASGAPRDKHSSDRLQHIFTDGTFHEDIAHDWIQKTAFRLHSVQMALDLDMNSIVPSEKIWSPARTCHVCGANIGANTLHGHIDGVLTDMLGVDRHYEFKGMNCYTFEKYWSLTEVPLDYFTQCAIYNLALRKYVPSLTQTLLLVKNKNTAQFLEYLLEYDVDADTLHVVEMVHSNGQRQDSPIKPIAGIVRQAIEKLMLVHEHVVNGTLPDRPFAYGEAWQCDYCNFGGETCWGAYVHEVESFADDGDLADIEDADVTVKHYLELGMHAKEMEAEQEQIKSMLKARMKEKRIKTARVGDFLIVFDIRQEQRLKKKDDIPPALLPQLMRTSYKEVLNIKPIASNGNASKHKAKKLLVGG